MQDELAKSVTYEQGKTLADAKGDVFRGLGECTNFPPDYFAASADVSGCCGMF